MNNSNNYSFYGLTKDQVKKSIHKNGKNILPKKSAKTLLDIYIEQYKNPIIYILFFASFIALLIQEYSDAMFILAVLILNSIIGTFQEYRAEIKAKSLEESFKTQTTVIRDGITKKIPSEDLAVGDFVVVESGDKVGADLTLKKSHNLFVDESLLTGESLEVEKDFQNKNLNKLFAGTIIAKGRGVGEVSAVGINSQIGTIATLLIEASKAKAPLEIRIKKLSISIVKVMMAVICAIFLIGFLKDLPFTELLFVAIALSVSAMPEGLPIAITVALSSASYTMSKKGVIIRKLSAIEALGSCTMIASDKTGTLTKNELSVDRFVPSHTLEICDTHKHIIKLGSLLCNEMKYHQDEEDIIFLGDQVDIALAKHVLMEDDKYLLDVKDYNKVDEIPYESQNRYSAVLVQKDEIQYEFIKGSPETILEFCDISKKDKEKVLDEVNSYANNGFRNIALAFKKERITDKTPNTIKFNDFEYLGFMAIIDPLREESYESVKMAKEAGIDVVMITGDHPNTAFYIAKQLEICENKNQIMDYEDILKWIENGRKFSEIQNIKVFSRIRPEQKKEIVCALQDGGNFVAVTGDGVNDAPALKHANIGVAMGKGGTDIAKSVGDIILTDDNFSSIIKGIKEGRRAYDNIRKVIYLLISTGFAEIILILLSFLAGLPIPLLPVQLLWLNLVTNGMQDVFLAFEDAEKGILKRKPRPPKERIFNPIMIRRVLVGGFYIAICSFIIFYILLNNGYNEYSARNITLLLMVLFENVHVFNSRSETLYLHEMPYKNSILLIILVIFTQIVHILSMQTPFMQNILSIEPVSFNMWLILLIIAFGLSLVMEFEKYLRRRKI